MHYRMPGSKSQASQGGISPGIVVNETISNSKQISRNETEKRTVLRQATLSWPTGKQKEEEKMEENSRPRQHEPGTWIEGGKE